MIRKVVIRRFKRFQDTTFEFPGHVVIAGPNNTGKTTALQAIAAWNFSYNQWKTLNNFNPRNGYERKPIARQAFSSVPLRTYDLLWRDRRFSSSIEIEVVSDDGWVLAMELVHDSTEQIYVHPKSDVPANVARDTNLNVVFIPAMTGLSKQEPWYHVQATIDDLLGQAKPGDVLRNLLVQAHQTQAAWDALQESIQRLFGFELVPPDTSGPYIIAEYRARKGGPTFDIASAGSGFQQVLMLLTFLNTRPGSVLLLDEPDAHLHVILQEAIFGELRAVAASKNSQLIIATHSEQIIDAVDPTSLCVLLNEPKLLATTEEQAALITSLSVLSQTDIMVASDAKGVLYTEDFTDLEILRAWARVLKHPFSSVLPQNILWKKIGTQPTRGGSGVSARDHYEALSLVKDDFPGVELIDGDAHPDKKSTAITGKGLQRLRWRRYEIESYLVHPASLERFVEGQMGPGGHSAEAKKQLHEYLVDTFKEDFLKDPLGENKLVEAFLESKKARTVVLPPILSAGGLPAFPYQRYHEIADVMLPQEIHPDVTQMLNAIMAALGL